MKYVAIVDTFDGFIKWADAEQVNDIVIAIDTRLGDLLIMEGQS